MPVSMKLCSNERLLQNADLLRFQLDMDLRHVAIMQARVEWQRATVYADVDRWKRWKETLACLTPEQSAALDLVPERLLAAPLIPQLIPDVSYDLLEAKFQLDAAYIAVEEAFLKCDDLLGAVFNEEGQEGHASGFAARRHEPAVAEWYDDFEDARCEFGRRHEAFSRQTLAAVPKQ